MSKPIFRRGFAGLAAVVFALALALPALAKEKGERKGDEQESPSHAREDSAKPPAHSAPAPEAQSAPAPSEGKAQKAGKPEKREKQERPAKPDKAEKAEHAAEPEPEPAAAQPQAPPARVRKRAVGQPDISESPPAERRLGRKRERRVAATPKRRGRAGEGDMRARAPSAAPGRIVPEGVNAPPAATGPLGQVAAAASPNGPPRPERRAEKSRSEALAPPQPLPAWVFPRPLRQIVEVVPGALWAALGGLTLIALGLGLSSWLAGRRASRLRRQREVLLQEVGLLQEALLPTIADDVPVSVAYRPADGPAAGGDFYEAFTLADGRTAIVLGDVSGHGREALARTTLIRYTLRAYLEAGLAPCQVVKVGSDALSGHLDGGFATVTVAVHDAASGRFTYASAGHAPPLVVGPGAFEPVTACSAPPIGIAEPTGFRQSTFTLTAGSVACLYTDGVVESRVDGRLVGLERLHDALEALPPDAGAEELLARMTAIADHIGDDMAVCLLRAGADAPATGARIEELEVDEHEVGDSLERFLRACGVPLAEVPGVLREAGEATRRVGSATVRVRLNEFRPGVDVIPGNVVRLEERRRAVRA